MQSSSSFAHLSDAQLTAEVGRLAEQERASTADLVACLEEFDRRRLYLALGFSSLFAYGKERLHLNDGAAYRRIEVARASRRYPVLLEMLRDGRLSLTTACLLASKLTPANAEDLFSNAAFKSKREVEALLAARHPQPPVPSVLRKLPEPGGRAQTPTLPSAPAPAPAGAPAPAPAPAPAGAAVAAPGVAPSFVSAPSARYEQPPSRRPVVAPLSPAHYKLQVTISAAAHARLREIQDLMRHAIPNGDPAAIVEHALDLLHGDLLRKKTALVTRPRNDSRPPRGRQVPAQVRREVWRRDGGRCAFIGAEGTRCGERGMIEYHHVDPVAHGGKATVANIELRCRAHNGFEWARDAAIASAR